MIFAEAPSRKEAGAIHGVFTFLSPRTFLIFILKFSERP